jgi:hypothetical protein
MAEKNYPAYHEHPKTLMKSLANEAQGPMSGFAQLHKQASGSPIFSVKLENKRAK